ncbi:deoxyguanosinetriphosphate triphosphohydrolase [Roseospira marina]|uniref:Deoxyguanosinetriphosphate triphosphohydrolase-like protein n=1 Tax=Roseospira marina TaxID=140057 RepID=A0A5M6IGU1_9PROT|nr:deoxyguanosinetriphosphate triphosphohydrolase [Roseospira marina]KAA5606895.1 deoxyguanosinetriphosphate triphosphohydrolase [Roseospira marina]MBB4312934.1 dGTPase [Roseospira marina]MBB5086293.1 dGTPase [Roseospira marina]
MTPWTAVPLPPPPPPLVLAACASDPVRTRGRLVPEAESATRTAFQRDRDRIIHCGAFRRLQYKTQVFVYHEGENYRTRLTHSLEVAQIARSIARVLGLNEDLAEALALAHDLGHTCFGHAGEMALKACMAPHRGFDHNAQSLRILTKLEHRYAAFDGLNLTWESLEGLVKHNGPLTGPGNTEPLPLAIQEYAGTHDLELNTYAGPEAQVAALSDDIAYNAHDIDDGLRAGLFTEDDLRDVPLAGPVFAAVAAKHPGLDRGRLIHESVRRIINAMVADLCAEAARRFEEDRPGSVDDVRAMGRPLVAFSDAMRTHDQGFKAFLFPNMYRHHRVNRMTSKARRVVRDLFDLLLAEPILLPSGWAERARAAEDDTTKRARVVADYIAGMTDRFALDEHARLFDPTVKP